ncbi:MTH938/NDUFAF3 family protein [Candidatus Mycolicibacterium alkanivorans]|uniref:MTH938/NDUFAF3 family protein n=1 Tax=Candidatus Mycolicibacterium alkanivorans TaxID=2954114 RepID=A0ABS9YW33_9MYCO|nr:MTH938/NDUFAF3 family protein [Candidatus Mycolicibacterium alkanivorans]MCI4674973.1 MTH938/NDUFAF3 family protein [Candidatus Mycolicibacterium alkanivorans]
MEVRFLGFGAIEVEGRKYEHDLVIDRGAVRKRSKKPSKPYRDKFGHTPLSAAEEIPWGGTRLIVGTGAHGALPIMPEVVEEGARRNIDLVVVPTEQACRLISGLKPREVRAVLHVTC